MKPFPESKERIAISTAGMWAVMILVVYLIFTQFSVLHVMDRMGIELRRQKRDGALSLKSVELLKRRLNVTEQAERLLLEKRVAGLQPRLDPSTVKAVVSAVYDHCGTLSPSLVIHLIFRESAFNQMAVSSKGAVGLMQIMMRFHKKTLGKTTRYELFRIDTNIKHGCKILMEYMEMSKTLTEALKRYVGGDQKGYIKDIYEMMVEYEVGKK